MKVTDVITDLGRSISFFPGLVPILGSINTTLLACQLIYWKGKERDPDGWIYKTQAEIQDETALTRDMQEQARKRLRSLGVIDEKRKGIPARLYYRINTARLNELWSDAHPDPEPPSSRETTPQSSMGKTRILDESKPAYWMTEKGTSNTEITSKITSEITSKENTLVVEPPKASQQRSSAQKISKFQEEFIGIYNTRKPEKWAGVQIPPPDLLVLIEKNRKAIADDELTKTYLIKALTTAAADNFWRQKETGKWSLINLLRKGNMITLAEVAGELDTEAATDSDRLALYEKLYAQGDAEALLRPIDPNKEPEEYKRRFAFYQRKGEEAVRAARLRA